jgi:hypothetical protein
LIHFGTAKEFSNMRFRNFPAGHLRFALVVAAAAGAITVEAAALVVYVNVDRLDIVEKKRAVAKTVTTVDRNAALNVIAQEGKWYKVEVGGKQGYVFESAVATQQGSGKGGGVPLSSVKSGRIPELDTAAATRGLGDGARQYASSGHLRTDGLEEMIRRRDALTGSEFEQFLTQGGLPGASASSGQNPETLAAAVSK